MAGKRRLQGTGSLRLRKSKKFPDGVWHLRYYDAAGCQVSEKTKFDSESKAQRLLAQRITEAAQGNLPTLQSRKALVEDLAQHLFKTERAKQASKVPESLPAPTRAWRIDRAGKVVDEQEHRWDKHLAPVFGSRKAALVTALDILEYRAARLKDEAAHATINGEIALLRRMYRLGVAARIVREVPEFPTKLAASPRQGFIDDDAFTKLHGVIKEPGLSALVLCAYRLGFRKAELQNLLCVQYTPGWLKLFAGATKNGKARTVALPTDVDSAVAACAKDKQPDAYLFTWPDGSPILDFRAAWAKTTAAAGVPKLMFHDLRRSAVRRMLRKGVPVPVVMKISGHLTRQVFDEYDVAGQNDLEDAARKI